MEKIVVIGGGNLGSAFASRLAKRRVSVTVTHRGDDNAAAVTGADVVILAVKPQGADEVFCQLAGAAREKLCISVMAGVGLARLQAGLRTRRIVRTMPNLAARVGRSVTAWTAPLDLSAADRDLVRAILGAIGQEFFVSREDDINAVTAACGSGLAYFFWIEELLIQFLVGKGFAKHEARRMAAATLCGAAQYRLARREHPRTSRRRVTSKRGTTNAAFKWLYRGHARALMIEAFEAAYRRSKELGK